MPKKIPDTPITSPIKLVPINTAGEGDCAFHAIFGGFVRGRYFCATVAEKRDELAAAIRATQPVPGAGFYQTIIEGIKALVMDFTEKIKLEVDAEKAKEECLSKISPQYKKAMDELLTSYMAASESFEWEFNQELFNAYADFVGIKGRYLMQADLKLIAEVFNVQIKYHSRKGSKITYHGVLQQEVLDGNPQVVSICFNGLDHYERMEEASTLDKKPAGAAAATNVVRSSKSAEKSESEYESSGEDEESSSKEEASKHEEEDDDNEKPVPTDQDVLETYQYFFPRCEYYTRWQESTHFAMKDSKHWGTYFRSTPNGGSGARYTTLFTDRKYINSMLNDHKHQQYTYGLAGSLFNPFSIKEYEKAVGCGSKEQTTYHFLYDAIIKYKLRICDVIETCYHKLANKKQKDILKVHFRNKYPCIMVRVSRFKKEEGFDSEGMHAVAMAYYIALVNKLAKKDKIPIELVVRSSFGHNNPSVDVTGNSFRINVGLIPDLYAEVLVNSLLKLADMVISNPKPQLLKKFVKEINKKIDKYNNDIKTEPKAIKRTEKIKTLEEELKTGTLSRKTRKNKQSSLDNLLKQQELKLPPWDQDLFKVLNQPGSLKQTENTHQSVVLQLTRRREYINLLIDYIMEELDEHKPRFVNPLRKWLAKFDFLKNKGITTVCLDVSDKDYRFQEDKHKTCIADEENSSIKDDKNFWNILKRISARLGAIEQLIKRGGKIKGLYAFLEWANKKYITEIKKSSVEEDVGSDSDYENKDEDKKLFAKKITVMTGMKAINLAHHLARSVIGEGESYKPLYTHMYYEIEKALKIEVKSSGIAKCHGNSKKHKLVFFDLNYCDSACNQGEKDVELPEIKNSKVIILDYTSATTTQIRGFVNKCLIQQVKVILLVSSGLKNEQAGADINPYGTVRIIADTRKKLDDIYKIACDVLIDNDPSDTLPAVAHDIRKAYKRSGFVVTNEKIFSTFDEPSSSDIFVPDECVDLSRPPPSTAHDKAASPISSAESELSEAQAGGTRRPITPLRNALTTQEKPGRIKKRAIPKPKPKRKKGSH